MRPGLESLESVSKESGLQTLATEFCLKTRAAVLNLEAYKAKKFDFKSDSDNERC